MTFDCEICEKSYTSKQSLQMHKNAHTRRGETATSFSTPSAPRPSVGLALRQSTALDVEHTEGSVEELRTALQNYKSENARLNYERLKFQKQSALLAELVTQLVDRVAVAEAHRP